jgi:AraC-like DNA-binding protein
MSKGAFRILRCQAEGVQAVEAATTHAFPKHWHEQYGIGLLHQGAHKSLSGRGMVEAGAGDIITVNPGETHDGAPIGEGGRSWKMLYFDPAAILGAFEDLREAASNGAELPLPVLNDSKAAALFSQLFARMTTGGDASPIHREELLLRLLARIGRERGELAPQRSAPAAIRIAKDRIDGEPTAPITLTGLARETGLSRFQVLRGFVRATGFTPHAYLVQKRINLARAHIGGGARLADAAASSGFSDQSHMTRIFVRKYGISPGAYAAAVA